MCFGMLCASNFVLHPFLCVMWVVVMLSGRASSHGYCQHSWGTFLAVVCCILPWCAANPNLVTGAQSFRVGEAQNPGPVSSSSLGFSMTVSNPCSLSDKHDHYADMPGHIHCVSETSQTAFAQERTQKAYRSKGLSIQWGHPVPSQRLNRIGCGTVRGLSTGVAMLTSLPHMACQDPLPTGWAETCRIVEGLFRVGPLTLKVVTLYGFQPSLENARTMTNSLLAAALDRAQRFPGPTVIAGDFNFSPMQLEIWPELARFGS